MASSHTIRFVSVVIKKEEQGKGKIGKWCNHIVDSPCHLGHSACPGIPHSDLFILLRLKKFGQLISASNHQPNVSYFAPFLCMTINLYGKTLQQVVSNVTMSITLNKLLLNWQFGPLESFSLISFLVVEDILVWKQILKWIRTLCSCVSSPNAVFKLYWEKLTRNCHPNSCEQ